MIVAGDFNVKTGAKLCPNPNTTISRGGKTLIGLLEESNLECVNDLHTGPHHHTHVDKTSGTSNILDYIITKERDRIEDLEIDTDLKFTPHYTRRRQSVYTDHLTVCWDILAVRREACLLQEKIVKWKYGAPGGAEGFRDQMETKTDEIMKVIVEQTPSAATKLLLDKMEEAKWMNYGKSTVTRKKLKRIEEKKLWDIRSAELEKFIEDARDQANFK